MWVRSALINRDSQKTDPQIQLLDYLDPSFWGDELRRVQLTTYEGFRALNSDKTRESIKTYSGPRKTGARSKIQSWGTILGTASHRYPYIKCGRCLANGMFGLLLFSYQSRNCIYSFMLHIIASFKSTLWCFPSYLYLCHCSQNYVRPEDVTLQVDKTWEEDTKIVSSILVPLLTALLA